MKTKILILISLIVFFSNVQAQLLWKVSGNGLKHPSYLFATHHLIPIQFLDSVPGLYSAFNKCETIVGEIVINNIEASSKIQDAAKMPKNTKMSELLIDTKYNIVDSELKNVLKIGLKELSMMNPTLILQLYEIELYKNNNRITDDTQSDSYFQLIAAEQDKTIVGLETIDQQIKILFGNETLERQANILYETILHKDSILAEMIILNKLYKTGKINELVQFWRCNKNKFDFTESEYYKLVDERNADWLSKLPGLFNKSSCFVAVGAVHFGGKKGLVKQLEKLGYRLKPVE